MWKLLIRCKIMQNGLVGQIKSIVLVLDFTTAQSKTKQFNHPNLTAVILNFLSFEISNNFCYSRNSITLKKPVDKYLLENCPFTSVATCIAINNAHGIAGWVGLSLVPQIHSIQISIDYNSTNANGDDA